MKKLTKEELDNLTIEKAWEVAGDFSGLIQNGFQSIYIFEDVLPWSKGDILVCLLKLLRSDSRIEAKEVIAANIVILVSSFIPNPDQYKKLLELKKFGDALPDISNLSIEESLKILQDRMKNED